jgi:hypothetical protein
MYRNAKPADSPRPARILYPIHYPRKRPAAQSSKPKPEEKQFVSSWLGLPSFYLQAPKQWYSTWIVDPPSGK